MPYKTDSPRELANISVTAMEAGSFIARIEKYRLDLLPSLVSVKSVGENVGEKLEIWPAKDYETNALIALYSEDGVPEVERFTAARLGVDTPQEYHTSFVLVYAAAKLRGFLKAHEPDKLPIFDDSFSIGIESPDTIAAEFAKTREKGKIDAPSKSAASQGKQ